MSLLLLCIKSVELKYVIIKGPNLGSYAGLHISPTYKFIISGPTLELEHSLRSGPPLATAVVTFPIDGMSPLPLRFENLRYHQVHGAYCTSTKAIGRFLKHFHKRKQTLAKFPFYCTPPQMNCLSMLWRAITLESLWFQEASGTANRKGKRLKLACKISLSLVEVL